MDGWIGLYRRSNYDDGQSNRFGHLCLPMNLQWAACDRLNEFL